MTIKFNFTKQDYDNTIGTLNTLGVLTDEHAEEVRGYWPQLDREIDGNEFFANDGVFKQIRFALLHTAFKALEKENR